ncbi:hypothetical protein A3841_18920 [Pontibacter flavimaris]|uniref:Uncharacterized protein n=1 Tax=Pontibacter flavimaris TaxID=1797110 RepID=A0A1Q5PDU8_9BACT|nr:hypothetical protein A3841_18920 [Pontibacter flavimaris]
MKLGLGRAFFKQAQKPYPVPDKDPLLLFLYAEQLTNFFSDKSGIIYSCYTPKTRQAYNSFNCGIIPEFTFI